MDDFLKAIHYLFILKIPMCMLVRVLVHPTCSWYIMGLRACVGVELRVRSFAKKIVRCFYMTILVVWSSLDHYKDNSKGGFNKNYVIRRLKWFTLFFI